MAVRRVIDTVPAGTTTRAALKAEKLTLQPGKVEQFDALAVDQRKRLGIDLRLRALAREICDATPSLEILASS